MFITVFTPTYNRAYILPKLYESLLQQSVKDFEWIIVDDGSTDDTEQIVGNWIKDNKIDLRYFKQNNGGKHRAINRGVLEAKGDFIFIVDSDDYLPQDSINRIMYHAGFVIGNNDYAGVAGLRCYPDGRKIGGGENFGVLNCTSTDFRFKYRIKGDMGEVYKTSVLKQFPFPTFDDEKFCPESLVNIRIALKYKMRYFYEDIYKCEYLPDGLTASIVKIRMNSPRASTTYYYELFFQPIPLIEKIKSAINYWRFEYCKKKKFRIINNSIRWFFLKPIGYIYHLIDKKYN